MLNGTELDEIEAIREATAGLDKAYTALYDLNQTMSKGLMSTVVVQESTKETVLNALAVSNLAVSGNYDAAIEMMTGSSHAFGLGDLRLITGNTAVVEEPVTGVHGLFRIISDTHTWTRDVYRTKLTLSLEGLMDKQSAGSVPKK